MCVCVCVHAYTCKLGSTVMYACVHVCGVSRVHTEFYPGGVEGKYRRVQRAHVCVAALTRVL